MMTENIRSLQPGVFCVGLFQQRYVRVGIFPERQEILVSSSCLHPISCRREHTTELQACYCAHRICENNPRVVEYFLELRGGLGVPVSGQVSLPTHVRCVEVSEEAKPTAGYGQIVRRGV